MWFNSVKRYYDMGFYTKENVGVFVKANMITKEEYKSIVGEEYAE